MNLSTIWRRLDEPGHDTARLQETDRGWLLIGTAVYLSHGGPALLDYRVQLARNWTTSSGNVRGFIGEHKVDVMIVRDENGWTMNGQPQLGVRSMLDLDYGFTPATTLQQIRRMNLKVGETAEFPVAWLMAGASNLVALPQTYHRLSDTAYSYQAPTVNYRATLIIPESGFVEDYPEGWIIESNITG